MKHIKEEKKTVIVVVNVKNLDDCEKAIDRLEKMSETNQNIKIRVLVVVN